MADETQTNTTETATSTATTGTDASAESGNATKAADTGNAGDGAGATDATVDLAAATTGDGTGDGKGADAETGKDGKDDAGKDAPVVPEKYELNVTVKDAEGRDQAVEIDPVLLEAATPILKDLGLNNEQANKVAALVPRVQERILQQQADEFTATKADWAKQLKADPELGGRNWKETETLVAKALDRYAGGAEKNADGTYKSEFRQLLVDSGFANHPEAARLLRAVGADIAEDKFAEGHGKVIKQSREEVLFPDDVPKK